VPEQSGPKSGGGAAVPLSVWGAGSLFNTMSFGPQSTSVPSGILIHPAVWPLYTPTLQTDMTDHRNINHYNVFGTDRTDNGPIA